MLFNHLTTDLGAALGSDLDTLQPSNSRRGIRAGTAPATSPTPGEHPQASANALLRDSINNNNN